MSVLKRVLLFVAMLVTISVSAQVSPLLQTPYTPPQTRGTVSFFLEDISTRAGIPLSYSDELVKRKRTIRLKGTEHTIEEILQTILEGTNTVAVERQGKILLIPANENKPAATANVTISGFVRDSASREVLIGATVYVPGLSAGTYTNTCGFYSITIPEGKWDVISTYLGYTADTSKINLQADIRRDVLLVNKVSLAGVVVSSRKDVLTDHAHLTPKDINAHAGLLGENDVMRALQYIPGVQSGTDGTSSVLVRGGDPGQNLNLLDGVPLYYVDHFYGLTSIFNTDAVKSVDFYKGAFPSRYGGRVSSIIDVASKDGNMERVAGQASIGLLKGNLTLETPIVKEKASLMLAARRTWIDALWRPFYDGLGVDFYDINVKGNCIVNKNNRFYAAFYTGRDQFRLDDADFGNTRAIWGNTIGSARWTSIINPKLFINSTATYSYFRFQLKAPDWGILADSLAPGDSYTGSSEIREASLRVQADYYASPNQHIQMGAQYALSSFLPASVTFGSDQTTFSAAGFRSNEIVLFAEDELKLLPKLTVRAGLHLAGWISEDYNYISPQPRLFVQWKPSSTQNLFASVTRMSQFLHLLNSNTLGAPIDFWLPSTSRFAPEQSWLVAAGYTRKVKSHIELSAEVFYKDIRHIITYKPSGSVFQNSETWQDQLEAGRGYAYGLETGLRGQFGPFSTSLAYTLSWAWRQFDAQNNGEPFPYRFDRRHNFHAELVFQKSSRFNAVAGWSYMSGEAITLPDQLYPDFDNNLPGGATGGPRFTYNYTARNNYRLPAIHRLDVAVNFVKRKGKYFQRTWTLGLFNAYGQNNVVGVSIQEEPNGVYSLQGLTLFRFIPTVSYSIKF
jgi:hypothetical protein